MFPSPHRRPPPPHRRSGPKLWACRRGGIAVQMALLGSVLVGAGALSVDMGQALITKSQMQHYADATALAAAAELNGLSGARSRAMRAAGEAGTAALVDGTATFADNGQALQVASMTFLKTLPPAGQAITAADLATSDANAHHVVVVVRPRTVKPVFLQALASMGVGVASELTANAQATAGNFQVACDTPPLFICNPAESTHQCSLHSSTPALSEIQPGELLNLDDTSFTPGNFGLLDTPSGSQSVSQLRQRLGAVNPGDCYGPLVGLRPGQASAIQPGPNVRLDLYQNPGMKNASTDPQYRPAVNVQSYPLSGWNPAAYWRNVHGGALPAALSGASRYQVYRYEIDHNLIPAAPTHYHNAAYPPTDPATTPGAPDRRVMTVAVIDCVADGPLNGNSSPPVAPVGYIDAFLPSPMGQQLSLEVIRVDPPGAANSPVHALVQLER